VSGCLTTAGTALSPIDQIVGGDEAIRVNVIPARDPEKPPIHGEVKRSSLAVRSSRRCNGLWL